MPYEELCKAYRDFIAALYAEGCRSIQLDDCTWSMLCDADFRKMMDIKCGDIAGLQKLYVNLNNEAIAGLPEDLIVATHVCRGNYRSDWAASGGYAAVADELFVDEKVKAYYWEFDDERSGDFSPLEKVSGNKLVVLGLVTTKGPKLVWILRLSEGRSEGGRLLFSSRGPGGVRFPKLEVYKNDGLFVRTGGLSLIFGRR